MRRVVGLQEETVRVEVVAAGGTVVVFAGAAVEQAEAFLDSFG